MPDLQSPHQQPDHASGRPTPTVRPVSLHPTAQERRGLRRRETLILGLLAVMIIGAWVITLKF